MEGSSRNGMWSMAWIEPAQDREGWLDFVKAVLNLRLLLNAGNFLTSFSRRTLLHGVS